MNLPIYRIRNPAPIQNDATFFAFVLMPFAASFDDAYRLGIKETASRLAIHAQRVDEQIYAEGILQRIYLQIEAADFIIADMSEKNPNVFYEVGYAHAKNKLCILITNNVDNIPFDLKHHRHIVYSSIESLRTQLTSALEWAKSQLVASRQRHITLNLKRASGSLIKTQYSAKADVDLKFDLHNASEQPSPDIDAIYFYCGEGWQVYQDEKECPSTESDRPEFRERHFLSPPLRRLGRSGWAQIKLTTKRTLAWATEGEPLLDSYRLTGRAAMRLVTSTGDVDYDFMLDVTVDDIPF